MKTIDAKIIMLLFEKYPAQITIDDISSEIKPEKMSAQKCKGRCRYRIESMVELGIVVKNPGDRNKNDPDRYILHESVDIYPARIVSVETGDDEKPVHDDDVGYAIRFVRDGKVMVTVLGGE